MVLAIISEVPPVANGTTNLMGFSGYAAKVEELANTKEAKSSRDFLNINNSINNLKED
jgi:hypothetical protein